MVKIMIVDDEPIERMALQTMLENGLEDIQIVGLAGDGWQAIQLAEQWRPDLVLMDIQMPGLDGIETVRILKEKYGEMSFVIVSAYDTFHYAQQALRLQARDYLLKPSTEEDILKIIGNIVNDMKKERAQRNDRLEEQYKWQRLAPIAETDLVTQLLFGHVHEVRLDEMLQMFDTPVNTEMFAITLFVRRKSAVPDLETNSLHRTLKTEMHAHGTVWIGAMTAGAVPMILFRDPTKTYRSQALCCVRNMLNLESRYGGMAFFIGIGNPRISFTDIRQSYQEALKASRDLTLPSKYCFFEDIQQTLTDEISMIRLAEKEIMDALETGNTLLVKTHFGRLTDQLTGSGGKWQVVIHQLQNILHAIHKTLENMGIKADRPFLVETESGLMLRTEADSMLDELMETFEASVRNSRDLYQRMRTYIIDNAHRNISLESLAGYLQLSPYYVSKIFKTYAGCNYIDFLTEYRVQKAKELMKDPSKSLKQIAYDVGYHDPNYFSRVFKKVARSSPTDYKKRIPQNNAPID